MPNKKHGLDTIIKPFLYLDMKVEVSHLIVEGNKIYNMCESKPYDGAKPMYLVDDIDNRDILKVIIINTCNSLLIKKENKSKFIVCLKDIHIDNVRIFGQGVRKFVQLNLYTAL